MRFWLRGEVRFSRKLGEIGEEVDRVLRGATALLQKGAPKGKEAEACRIEEWHIEGDKLKVKLVSGRYVRAHDALLRLARRLGEELGKKHRIGVREIKAEEYKIFVPNVSPPKTLPIPGEVRAVEGGIELLLGELGEGDLRSRMVDRLLSSLVAEKPRQLAPSIVREGGPREGGLQQDVCELLTRLGWVREFPGRGQWIFVGPFARLVWLMEELVVEKVASPLGFQEAMFPKLIPLEVMQKMPGYLDGVPEGMFYVCPPPRDPRAFEGFKTKLGLTKKLPKEELEKIIKNPSYVLAPAQCEPFYEMFSGKMVRLEDLPFKIFDRSGWTYRWEGGGVEGLVRTQEFRRVELVFLGGPEVVIKLRDEALEKSVELAEEMGLRWRVLEATPFYMREGIEKEETVATYDLEIYLPYKNDWTEVGSYNVHRNKFVRSFGIKECKGREVWTGCCGFGTLRWAVAFLAQHGVEMERWPELVKTRMKQMPEIPRVVE